MRSRVHRVVVNGQEFSARHGEILLDAALMNGVDIPHDCRSGHCGTCRVRIVGGDVHGRRGGDPHSVQACQCRVVADVDLVTEDMPEIMTRTGRVTALVPLAPDVVEVRVSFRRAPEYLPGQYLRVQFRGMPARCFSPTTPMDRREDGRSIQLHVRRMPNGRVSSALGTKIRIGHRVKVTGPFGSAYLRPGLANRLVLVAGGTGFAPIWAIADAAIREHYRREIVLLAGVRSIETLYMIPALYRLAACPNVTVIPVTESSEGVNPAIKVGRPTEFMPKLRPHDLVYAAGVPAMVEAVEAACNAAGTLCYADPFVPMPDDEIGALARAMKWLLSEIRTSQSPTPASGRGRHPALPGTPTSRQAASLRADRRMATESLHAPSASQLRRRHDATAPGAPGANANFALHRSTHGVVRRH